MKMENYRLLAAVIAAHPNHRVVGRTRLQKTIKLLQRLGLPTEYNYINFFYGPYSQGLHSDVALLENIGLAKERCETSRSGEQYYVIDAEPEAVSPEIASFSQVIEKLSDTDTIVLELAATYDAFREMGYDRPTALEALRRKKGQKCAEGREQLALQLLAELGL
jgi:uncharacterized protein YwgA